MSVKNWPTSYVYGYNSANTIYTRRFALYATLASFGFDGSVCDADKFKFRRRMRYETDVVQWSCVQLGKYMRRVYINLWLKFFLLLIM